MGIQINGQTDTVASTTSGGSVTLTSAVLPSVSNISATRVNVSGISTFTSGPVLIGGGANTGTTSQPLQVTGGAYVSGSLGIGTTNPQYNLHSLGTSYFNVTSSTSDGPFYIAGNKSTTQGAIAHIRNDNVSVSDDVFGGIKFSSSPGADFIIGKNTRLNSGYLQVRRENGTQLLTLDGSGNLGIGSATPAFQLTVDQGTSDGNLFQLKNEELGFVTGVWGTGSTYPREVTLNATRVDSGSSPSLRLSGQGGIKFAVDLNTVRMEIDSSGRVTMPYQPKFHVYGVGGGTYASGNYWIFPSTLVNIGNHYNTSNGIFTAPIAGTYLFYWSFIGNSTNDIYRYSIYKNNSAVAAGIQLRIDTSLSGSDYGDNGAMQTMLTLSANDTIRIYFGSDGGSSSYPGTNAPSDPYPTFGGQLLG